MASLFLVSNDGAQKTLADAEARARALDITQSFIVEAPAGSGKTGLMLQRFLKLLAMVDEPSQVLAITFTRKATAELRERILAQLQNAQLQNATDEAALETPFDEQTRRLAEAVLAHDAARGWELLDHPHRLNVRTIDSLAMDIAAGLPILSGSGGSQTPDPDPEPMYAEAAHRTLMQLGGANAALNNALEAILLHRDGNLANCQSLIATMLGQRDQWAELIPIGTDLDDRYLDENILPMFERVLDLAICRGLTVLDERLPPDLLESLARLGARIGHSPHCTGLSPAAQSAELEHWIALVDLLVIKGGTYRKAINNGTFKVPIDPADKAELVRLIDRIRHDEPLCELLASLRALPPARYPRDQWPVAKALFHVLSRALAELQVVFSARSSCDFAEFSLQARGALRADTALDDLRASASLDLQHLLVDEMQDTSSGQYELLQLLTQRWDGHSQTVFLVGDPKQSIYKFRQARVERFLHTLHTGSLGHAPDSLTLQPLHLTANFRSRANLVDSFNEAFTRIFPGVADPLQPESVPYLQATAVRSAANSRGTHWHTATLPYLGDNEAAATRRRRQRRVHAAGIRDVIAEFLGRAEPLRKTMAVLVRNRIHLHEIVTALKRADIPYRAVEIEPLGERAEILDIIALTRALLHPADRTAWLALLRTPWCGLKLADIHCLAGGDDHAYKEHTVLQLIESRGDLLGPDAIARLEPFWTTLTAALDQRERQPLAQWVHQTWRALNTHLYLDQESLSSVHRFLALIDELEDAGTLSLSRLEQRLSRLYATPSVHPGAVDLMTIHGAKGLEWDLVLVPGLERVGMNTNGKLLDWLEADPTGSLDDDETAPGIVAPIRGKGGELGKLNEWMRAVDRNRETAERKRLFYVACTRAREELHLFATLEENSKGEANANAGSLLAAAWPAAEAHFQPAVPATQSAPPQGRPAQWIEPLALAASAEEEIPEPRIIQRIPLPPFALTPPPTTKPSGEPAGFAPAAQQAALPARALGIVTHALLEQLTLEVRSGASPADMLSGIGSWNPRITTLLRTTGLAPQEVQRQAATVLRALTQALTDPQGRWLLSAKAQSTTELTHAVWDAEEEVAARLRPDRTFFAGAEPLSAGEKHLWIVDYKTATHGPEDLDGFLAAQREQYRAQLEGYGRILAEPGRPVRLALYYPLLQRLIWWSAG